MQGRIHSFQSLGTVDGPGVRAVVFMQGCPLRCACCHNPDTWDFGGGKLVSAEEIFRKIQRLRAYFGKDGGVTVSGGEPLLQADFVAELFSLCRADGISCALDTSGCVYNESVERLLSLTDLVLLDYKYTNDTDYKKYTGMSMQSAEDFLARLDALGKRVWIRQVIIPTLNDSEESVRRLYALSERYSCIEKTELLPFRKLCVEKYRALGIDFPLENIPEASEELIERLKRH
ncbi:MAG: pyruvate formate lyase-activating protein [Clostridia bacterium]|nr:pyruvate formate lyase-activating protein [Clostridia bacterium]